MIESLLAKLAEQWPILAFMLAIIGTTTGATVRWYLTREAKRETEAKAREKACIDRLQLIEKGHIEDLRGCVNRNTVASTAQAETNRTLASSIDRLTAAIAERR